MFAARREHVEHVIRPALARGDWVRVRPLHRRDVRLPGRRPRRAGAAHRRARGVRARRLQPDLTLLFDVPLAVSRERLVARAGRRPHARQVRGRAAGRSSRACATPTSSARRAAPQRFRVIDSSRPLADVRAELSRCSSTHGRRAACPWQARSAAREALARRDDVAARAAAHRVRAASASVRWRALRAGAAVRDAARGRLRVRHVRELRLRRRGPASRPARARARRRGRRRRGEGARRDPDRRTCATHRVVAAHEPPRRRQGGDRRCPPRR